MNPSNHLEREAKQIERAKEYQIGECVREMQAGATDDELRSQAYAAAAILAARERLSRMEQTTQERLDSALKEAGK